MRTSDILSTESYRLARAVGIVYIALGLFNLINYFYQKPINFFQIFFYVSIGIGMFEKHAWSRILCIISSGLTVIVGFLFFIFGGVISWNGAPVFWGEWYVIVVTIIHSLLLYILLRKDVKNIFVTKES